ncbi:unnamed protein product [Ceutorhynchus assimilis]|uniref:Odorant receptor n=1 Tax=Ceutorhynchus assimilis TaxID=467358 RepID=A0A9N9MGT4_9CUCU|nr:unnamed protein product [Ceutorhynchus assimilis]
MLLAHYFAMLPDILGNKGLFYSIYTVVIYLLALFCNLSELIKLYQIITADIFIFDELIRNFVITGLHFTSLLKCLFLRSKLGGRIFKKIINYEKQVYESGNKQIVAIYEQVLSSMRRTRNYYAVGILVVVVFYIAAPSFRDPYYIQKGNRTIVVQQMPLSSWTPLEENYWFSYIWTSSAGAYLTIFFVTTDLTCYSFIMFGVCQINILNHFISNFYQYSKDIEINQECTQEESFRILQRELIMMHQEAITYIKELNSALKNIMFLDFVPSSIQLAGIIFQLMTNLNIIQCILLGEFILTLIARIFIYCNNAHMLSVQSQKVASTWYNIPWNELPEDVRRDMVFCIMRAQKPLCITIGALGPISLTTFLAILKGTYSYMMLLMTIE